MVVCLRVKCCSLGFRDTLVSFSRCCRLSYVSCFGGHGVLSVAKAYESLKQKLLGVCSLQRAGHSKLLVEEDETGNYGHFSWSW